jgi:hypothetical protein
LILAKDNLPRCPKCGVRPVKYAEYEYHTQEIDADNNGIPILEVFSLQGPLCDDMQNPTFIVAECSCGNQWKLDDFSEVTSICYAYKEGPK